VNHKIDLQHKLRSGASIEQADKLIFSCIKMPLYKLQKKRVAIHIMVLHCKYTDAIHAVIQLVTLIAKSLVLRLLYNKVSEYFPFSYKHLEKGNNINLR